MANSLTDAQLQTLHTSISSLSDQISQIKDVVETADDAIFINSSTISGIVSKLIAQGFPTTPATPNSYGLITFSANYNSIALKRVHNLGFCNEVLSWITTVKSPGNVDVVATIETLPIDPSYQQVG